MPLAVKMPDVVGVERRVHDAFLDRKQPVLDRVDHREIAVDDEIENRIEDIIGAVRQFRRQGFEPRAHLAVRPRRPVTDTYDEVTTQEEGGFARLDRIAIAIAGAGDDEQLLAIGFDLWKLVGLQRVLDRQRMQAETLGDAFELAGGRLEQA